MSVDSWNTRTTLAANERTYEMFSVPALDRAGLPAARLPFALKLLLENLLRHEDGRIVSRADIEGLARWDPQATPAHEIAFAPARVLLQDFTGVPAVVDLAAMRDAMAAMGGDPNQINPLQPVELVVDHSVQVDAAGTPEAFRINAELEFERNRERYEFLHWGQRAFQNFRVVPPDTGIVHQVNLEYLARVVFVTPAGGRGLPQAIPDTLLGTDSHTTMINGLGVLGWGVGGIEAEAAMLGQPVSMLVPQVVGVRLTGRLRPGSTATDLVLTVTERLRKHGVVGKFVEFFGPGLDGLPVADRATIANMCPEYGATCGLFPIDEETLRYLRLTGRTAERVELIEAYAKSQGWFRTAATPEAQYSDVLAIDLGAIEPSVAGPKRPQDRLRLHDVSASFRKLLEPAAQAASPAVVSRTAVGASVGGPALDTVESPLRHGSVVIAAITSCTNTSNPSVMIAAGLLARHAARRGLTSAPWVKTSLAPGSKVVTEYLKAAGLLPDLERLGFHLVGYGCTTCIGNSGPLRPEVSRAIEQGKLIVAAVLSGNRNFEGRIHAEVKANYLMSPPLVVAYAIAGRVDIDLTTEPLGADPAGQPVYLRDLWPGEGDIEAAMSAAVQSRMFVQAYADVYQGDERWNSLSGSDASRFVWDAKSTYIKAPPYFARMPREAASAARDIRDARVLARLGDSITTDHISPAGSIKRDSPAGRYLLERGVSWSDFNSYGARRGNHEVMMRGTFANIRLRNLLAPGTEGGVTVHLPSGEALAIFDAAMRYQAEGVPLIVLAGKEYGSGSSRDWAAKGPALLGVKAVIAESFERIHRSNLIGMGVLPLQFLPGQHPNALGLTGREAYDITGLSEMASGGLKRRTLRVSAAGPGGEGKAFDVTVRIDTPQELQYYLHGGILPYVLRQLLRQANG